MSFPPFQCYRVVYAELLLTKPNARINCRPDSYITGDYFALFRRSAVAERCYYDSSIVTSLRAAGTISNGTKMSARGN